MDDVVLDNNHRTHLCISLIIKLPRDQIYRRSKIVIITIITRSIWKMLGPFATASRRTPIHQVSLLSHARIDVHDNDDNDNAWQRWPLWPHGMGPIMAGVCARSRCRWQAVGRCGKSWWSAARRCLRRRTAGVWTRPPSDGSPAPSGRCTSPPAPSLCHTHTPPPTHSTFKPLTHWTLFVSKYKSRDYFTMQNIFYFAKSTFEIRRYVQIARRAVTWFVLISK